MGKIALLSALCMFFKASGRTQTLSYHSPLTDSLLFVFLFLPHLCCCVFFEILYHIIMQCYKSFKNEYKAGNANQRLYSYLSIQVSNLFLVTIATCTIVTATILSRHLYSRGAGLSSYLWRCSFLPRQTKPKPVLKWT